MALLSPFDTPTGSMSAVNDLGTQAPLQPASQNLAIGESPSLPELDSVDDFIFEVRKCYPTAPEVTYFISDSLMQALSLHLIPHRPMTHPLQKRPHFSGESATGSLDKNHLRRMIHSPMHTPLLRRPFGLP